MEKTNLFDLGYLMSLRVGSWSGRRMVSKEDMEAMGVNVENIPENLVNYGRKLLVPKETLDVLRRIEQRSRKFLNNWSKDFGITNTHFVPVKNLENIENELVKMRKEFYYEVDGFINKFESLKEEMEKQYPEFWNKCLKDLYPSPESLRERFHFNWSLFKIGSLSYTDTEKEIELRQKLQEEVTVFVGEYVEGMRSEVLKFCELITCRINETPFGDEEEPKKLTKKTLGAFKKCIEKFRVMNIFEDTQIEKSLLEFKQQFLDIDIDSKACQTEGFQNSVKSAIGKITKQAAISGQEYESYVNEVKRKIVI